MIFRHETEGRQNQDVDFGMTEDPEEMLPEKRVSTGGNLVELRPEETSNSRKTSAIVMTGNARTSRN